MTILSSWRECTQKQYQVYLDKWQSYAGNWNINPFYPSVNNVIEFLQELFDKGLSYSSIIINTARSTLSSFVILEGNTPIGTHPFVQRFIKGVYQSRPALPRFTTTWDTSIVLTYLQGLWPLGKLNLQQLTYKLVMLCALVKGQRCQTLRYMNLRYMDKNSEYSSIFTI